MGEQYPRLRIESNYYGKVIGISAPSIAKHDLDFICKLSSASAAERIVALWNAMRAIDDPTFRNSPRRVSEIIVALENLAVRADPGIVEPVARRISTLPNLRRSDRERLARIFRLYLPDHSLPEFKPAATTAGERQPIGEPIGEPTGEKEKR